MEYKDNSLISLFIFSIVLSFVKGFVGSYPILLWEFDNIQTYSMYAPIFSIVNIIISPVLIFVVFYQFGKKFNLKSNLKATVIRLLIGAYVGHFLAFNIVRFFSEFGNFWSTLFSSTISLAFLSTFFTAFTALAISYLKQNN